MNYFVIIVTYNGEIWLKKCLDSILKSTLNLNIVLIDNNSSDNTLSIASEYQSVKIMSQASNLGFGRANNLGIRYALDMGADYLMLLNQDAFLQKDTYKILVESAESQKNFGVISPIHLNGNGSALDKNFTHYMQANEQLLFDALQGNYQQILYHVPFVNAACWLLPRQTLETIGGFDPIFYHYGEDNNYCQRLIYHNLKIGINPLTEIYHDREERVQSSQKEIKDWSKFKNYVKVKLGDINLDRKSIRSKIRTRIKTDLLIAFVKFNRSQMCLNLKKLNYLRATFQKVETNRELSKQKGTHFL